MSCKRVIYTKLIIRLAVNYFLGGMGECGIRWKLVLAAVAKQLVCKEDRMQRKNSARESWG